MLDKYDLEDIGNGMILSHFSEENLTENGFLEEPEYCDGLYN